MDFGYAITVTEQIDDHVGDATRWRRDRCSDRLAMRRALRQSDPSDETPREFMSARYGEFCTSGRLSQGGRLLREIITLKVTLKFFTLIFIPSHAKLKFSRFLDWEIRTRAFEANSRANAFKAVRRFYSNCTFTTQRHAVLSHSVSRDETRARQFYFARLSPLLF